MDLVPHDILELLDLLDILLNHRRIIERELQVIPSCNHLLILLLLILTESDFFVQEIEDDGQFAVELD